MAREDNGPWRVRRRRKARPHIRAAGQRSLLWLLLGVLILGGVLVSISQLGRWSAMTPYEAYRSPAAGR